MGTRTFTEYLIRATVSLKNLTSSSVRVVSPVLEAEAVCAVSGSSLSCSGAQKRIYSYQWPSAYSISSFFSE